MIYGRVRINELMICGSIFADHFKQFDYEICESKLSFC